MGDRRERACARCGSLLHHEDACFDSERAGGLIRVVADLLYDHAGVAQLPSACADHVWVDEAAFAIRCVCLECAGPTARESALIYITIMRDEETRMMAESLWRLGGDEGRTNEALATLVRELLSHVR